MAVIPGLNYVESTIKNEIQQVEVPNETANATLVFGTGRSGRSKNLLKTPFSTVADTFGPAPSGQDFDTNLTHAILAIHASTAGRDTQIYGYKVGDSASAKLALYESQVFPSGDRSFSVDINKNPLVSMEFISREENALDNQTKVIVNADNSGLPISMQITLSDGFTQIFAMDPYGVRTNVSRNVQELVSTINAVSNIRDRLTVKFNPMRQTNLIESVIQDTPNGTPYIEVGPNTSGLNQSWGDKLLDIEEIRQRPLHSERVTANNTSVRLSLAPDKDALDTTVTIQAFTKHISEEILQTSVIDPSIVGSGQQIIKTLYVSTPPAKWDNNPLTDIIVWQYPKGDRNANVVIPSTDYSIVNGVITVNNLTLDFNDLIAMTYSFGAGLVEANRRSQLQAGDENNYFIAGNDIFFGAAPTNDMTLTYWANKIYVPSDINVVDPENIKIQFINPDNQPIAGENIYITFTFLPELPAPTGAVINGVAPSTFSAIQAGSLQGGTAGSNINKQRYYELIEEALDATALVPFRRIMIAGAYIDDNIDGIDPETGLPGRVKITWADLLSRKMSFRSKVSGEVSTVLGVKPIDENQLGEGIVGINRWYDDLIKNTDDPFTPISAINALDSFHIDVALGVPLVADSTILGGSAYIENPAYIICGMQIENPLTQSLIKASSPSFIQKLLVTFPSGTLVGELNNARYTTLVVDPKGIIVVADAPTGAAPNTSMSRQIVRDTVYVTVRMARDIATPFIGGRRDAQKLSLLEQKINRDVNRAMLPDYLGLFSAELIPVPGGHISGATKLRLLIETSVEIRKVFLETTVKLGGEGL